MAELKTQENDGDVAAFLASIEDDTRRADCRAIAALLEELTSKPPRMWGKSIVGFGTYHYRYASGREGEWMRIGFAPRKRDITLYLMDGYEERGALLERLGKHKTGKSCLYLKGLAGLDEGALRELISASLATMQERYPVGSEPSSSR